MPLPTGTRLGPYLIEAPLGAGGMILSAVNRCASPIVAVLNWRGPVEK